MQRLDEVQSYVLLRRWQSDNKAETLALQLTAAQLESIMDFYSMERSYAGESQKLLIQLSQSEAYTQSSVFGCGGLTIGRMLTCTPALQYGAQAALRMKSA